MARTQESAADEGVVDTGVRQAPTTLASSYGGKSQMLNLADIDKVYQQIVGQGTMGQWTGKGWGSADANAKAMAQNLVASGITDIKQVGQSTVTDPGYTKQREDGSYEEVAPATRTVIINKDTGKPLLSDYAERTDGNAWSGTYTGGGNTAYRVQMDAQGNPIFYTTAASSSDADAIMPVIAIAMMAFPGVGTMIGGQLLGAIGVTATPAITAALGNAIMQTVLSGGDIKKGVTAAAASYLGAQAGAAAGEAFSGTELQGFAKNLATNVTRAAITGTDIGSAALGSAAQSATDYLTKNIPGFKDLSPAVKNTINQSISMSLQGANIDPAKMLETAMLNGATAYGLSQITGFDKLDPKQQGVISSFLQTAIRGGDLSALAMRTAIGLANQEVSRQVAGETAAVKKTTPLTNEELQFLNEDQRRIYDQSGTAGLIEYNRAIKNMESLTTSGRTGDDTGGDTLTGGADTLTGVAGADTAALPANQVAALNVGDGTYTVTGGTDVVDSLIDAGLVDDANIGGYGSSTNNVATNLDWLTASDDVGSQEAASNWAGPDTATSGVDNTQYALVWDDSAGTEEEGAGAWVQVNINDYLQAHPDLTYNAVTGEFTPIDSGGSGTDTVTGGAGADVVDSLTKAGLVDDESTDTQLTAKEARDRALGLTVDDGFGGGTDESVSGTYTGTDTLTGGSGTDTVTGGADSTRYGLVWDAGAGTEGAGDWVQVDVDAYLKDHPDLRYDEVTGEFAPIDSGADTTTGSTTDDGCGTGWHADPDTGICVLDDDSGIDTTTGGTDDTVTVTGQHTGEWFDPDTNTWTSIAATQAANPGWTYSITDGWTKPTTKIEEVTKTDCLPGKIRDASGECVWDTNCDTGYHWDDTLLTCVQNVDVVDPTVVDPTVIVTALKCPIEGQIRDADGNCVWNKSCQTGYHWDDELNQCMEDVVTPPPPPPPPPLFCDPALGLELSADGTSCVPIEIEIKKCPIEGQIRDANGNCDWDRVCKLPNQHWDENKKTCVDNVDDTQPLNCVAPFFANDDGTACVLKCEYPQVPNADGTGCVDVVEVVDKKCKPGFVFDEAEQKCVPIDCGTGYHWDPELNQCMEDVITPPPPPPLVCDPDTEELSEDGLSCIPKIVVTPPCRSGWHPDPDTGICVLDEDEPCDAGWHKDPNTGVCVLDTECQDGFHPDENGICVPDECKEGYVRNLQTGICELAPCPTGYSRNSAGVCVIDACPTGYTRNSEGACVLNTPTTCPTGFHKDSTGNCVADTKTVTTDVTLPTLSSALTPQVIKPFYAGEMEDFDLFTTLDELLHPKAQQNPQEDTKMADGGYLDQMLAEPMSVDDLLKLLR